jgi:hypothetical protein
MWTVVALIEFAVDTFLSEKERKRRAKKEKGCERGEKEGPD